MGDQTLQVRVQPGPGLVARTGDGLLVAPGGAEMDGLRPLLDALEEVCGAQPAAGRVLARRLVGHLVQADPASVPDFAVVAPTDGGWAIILHGTVELAVSSPSGEERLDGRDAATWVDRLIPTGFTALAVGAPGMVTSEPVGPFDLRAGVVPGGGIVMAPAAAGVAAAPPTPAAPTPQRVVPQPAAPQPAPAAPVAPLSPSPAEPLPHEAPPAAPVPEPEEDPTMQAPAIVPPALEDPPAPPPVPEVEEPAQDLPFESILLTAPAEVEPRTPLPTIGSPTAAEVADPEPEGPIVDGILCERDHFNHPLALYCSTCGVSTVHKTRTSVKGPRPTLGVLVGDDGSAYALDHDYLVGREPELDPGVESSELRPLKLQDAERSVSRVHAEVRLHDWDVTITDRGSANGTFVAERGQTEWRRLVADKGEVVQPGTRIAFGKRIMTFDTHHQA